MVDNKKYIQDVDELLSNVGKFAAGGLYNTENGKRCYVFILDDDLNEVDAAESIEMTRTLLNHIKEHLTKEVVKDTEPREASILNQLRNYYNSMPSNLRDSTIGLSVMSVIENLKKELH